MLLRVSGASASVGADPEEEPFPDYVVPEGLESALLVNEGLEQILRSVIRLAHEAGAPDNIACVIAEVVTA
jgi:serine/threonine protein phosphatase PrpC